MYEDLLVVVAKVDKVNADQMVDVKALKTEVLDINEKAEHNMDAAKLVRIKINSLFASK